MIFRCFCPTLENVGENNRHVGIYGAIGNYFPIFLLFILLPFAITAQTVDDGLSTEAGIYIDSVVSVMRRDALHRNSLDFGMIRDTIRKMAKGAKSVEDTHDAIKNSISLLEDHHSYFMTAKEVRERFGLTDEDIEQGKSGTAPQLEESKWDSLANSLEYATGELLDKSIGYLYVPSFENLYEQGMRMWADSLQRSIRKMDTNGLKGWIVDLRDNDGGNVTPMITGLGPLLDMDNVFFTVDKGGTPHERAFYSDGGFYFLNAEEEKGEPILRSQEAYKLKNPVLPIAILTGFKTASSAEAVVAIFAGQPNVKLIGARTNGLTSTNSFNFLEDNSVLNLTIGYYANREKKVYEQGISPDIEIDTEKNNGYGSKNDIVLKAAIEYIERSGNKD